MQPPPGMMMLENVSLEKFEKAVYARDYEQAGTLLLQNLRKFKVGAKFIGYPLDNHALHKILYTRFCAAAVALLADPAFELSAQGFDLLCTEQAIADLLFRASAFETSDHLLALGAADSEVNVHSLKIESGQALFKFLTTYSLVSAMSLNFEKTFSSYPQQLAALYAGMISPLLVIDRTAHDRREHLLGLHGIFRDCKLPEAAIPTIADAYMYSSYGTRRDKHAVKGTIHKMFADMIRAHSIPLPDLSARTRKDRPTILICLDWFNTPHAMFRCYAPIIRQLRERFHLVGMSGPEAIDDAAKAEFDQWMPINAKNMVLSQLIEQINALAPDVIYYPSIGMSPWWIATASVRLAPLQVMTLGHPASSQSPEIDYVLCDEGAIGDPAPFTEKIVTYPNGSARYVMRPDADMPQPLPVDEHPAVVKIAVPAMLCKLNANFMAALKKIDGEAKRPIQFHFFINMLGVNLHQAAAEIRHWLPGSMVYERRHYNQYIRELRECHIHLSTFPFGGTNSNIDSFLMGLPIVTLWGDEPHSRFDGMMIRRAQLPEWLIAKSEDEYVGAALRLINEDGTRSGLKSHLLSFDLDSEFFGTPPDNTAFLRAMESVYERQFDRPGSDLAPAGSADADRDGCGGAGPSSGLVPASSEADRVQAHADSVGADHGVSGEARA